MEQDRTSRLASRLTVFIRKAIPWSLAFFLPYAFTTGIVHRFAGIFGLVGIIGFLVVLFLFGALSGLECYQALRGRQKGSFLERFGVILFNLIFGTTTVSFAIMLILYLIRSFRQAWASF